MSFFRSVAEREARTGNTNRAKHRAVTLRRPRPPSPSPPDRQGGDPPRMLVPFLGDHQPACHLLPRRRGRGRPARRPRATGRPCRRPSGATTFRSNPRPTHHETMSDHVVWCRAMLSSAVQPDQSTYGRLSRAASCDVVQRRPATGRPPRAPQPRAPPTSLPARPIAATLQAAEALEPGAGLLRTNAVDPGLRLSTGDVGEADVVAGRGVRGHVAFPRPRSRLGQVLVDRGVEVSLA